MHSKSDNIEIMMGSETDDIIEELFGGSEFIFDNVDLLYYKFHKVSLNCGGTNMDSPE